MNLENKSRPYPITKEQVWEAFKLVRGKGGSAGVDGITIEKVKGNPEKHLYPVWIVGWTHMDIHQLSKALASKIRGWLYYYGKFHVSALRQAFRLVNRRLVKWAFNKYKRFKRTKSLRTARLWMRQVSKNYSYLFPHWLLGFTP